MCLNSQTIKSCNNGLFKEFNPEKMTEFSVRIAQKLIEPRHDKTNIVRLRPAWIQTSLRIRMLFAYQLFYK
jgi:hypothetical protein